MRRLLAIVGPTATGKSELGLIVAERFGGEIINADALQVYLGMDIGTAKPTPADQARAPHHLLDILEPTEKYSAGDFARRATATIEEVQSRGALPIVVGGSGLYLRALFAGISPLPRSDPRVRRPLDERLAEEGSEALWRELRTVDPAAAETLSQRDSQRIVRALEVAQIAGRPMTQLIAENPTGRGPRAADRIGLTLERPFLYDRIADRVHLMINRGWVEEVRRLLESGIGPEAPAFQAIGYRQIAAHLNGSVPLDQAVEETIRATRRFAKRQFTWFRKESDVTWFAAHPFDRCVAEVVGFLSRSD